MGAVKMSRITKVATVLTKPFRALERSIVGTEGDTKFPWRVGIALYLASFGLQLVFLQAYFWDDWTVYASRSKSETSDFFSSMGFGPLHSIIQVDLLHRSPTLVHLLSLLIFFLF